MSVFSLNRSADRRCRGNIVITLAALATTASLVSADTLLTSFETGGFDVAGEAPVVVSSGQTTGVTNGSFAINIDIPIQSWWIDTGHITVDPATILANQILKWDITAPTSGVQLIPIFLPNTGAGYYQGSGIFVGQSAAAQTMSYDYSGLGLPADATSMQVRFQASNSSAVNFFMDNVRVAGPAIVLGDSAQWVTNGSGDWVTGSNWDTGNPPGALGSNVTFGNNSGAVNTASQIVVSLTQPAQPANLIFDKGDGGYRITGASAINLTANVEVNSGNHQISAPLNAANGSIFNVAAGSSVTIDNLGGGGFGLFEKTGAGAMTADKVVNVNLLISGGTVNLKPGNAQNNGFIYGLDVFNGSQFNMNGAVLRVNSLSSNAAPGTINLGTNGVLNLGIYGAADYFGAIDGAGRIIVGGTLIDDSAPAQVCTLGGVNSYSGTTEVRNGNTLIVSASANLGDDSATNGLILDEGTLQASAGFSGARSLTVNAGGGTLDTNGNNLGFGVLTGTLNKVGAGELAVSRLNNVPNVHVGAGSLRLTGGAANASVAQAYTLAPGASLNVADGALVVDYSGASPLADIKAQVAAGYAAGAWNGVGVNSSVAAANAGFAVGYGEAASVFSSLPGTIGGVSVDGTSVILLYTRSGDADLNRSVNLDDFTRLAANFGLSGKVWTDGDSNFDGQVNLDDFTLLAANFGLAAVDLPRSTVPEPTGLAILFGALPVLSRRRRV